MPLSSGSLRSTSVPKPGRIWYKSFLTPAVLTRTKVKLLRVYGWDFVIRAEVSSDNQHENDLHTFWRMPQLLSILEERRKWIICEETLHWCLPVSLLDKTKVVVIQGDITDYDSVLEASRGADVIVHTASLVDVWYKIPDSLMHSVNIKGETQTGPTVGVRDGKETQIYQRFRPRQHKQEERSSCPGGISRTFKELHNIKTKGDGSLTFTNVTVGKVTFLKQILFWNLRTLCLHSGHSHQISSYLRLEVFGPEAASLLPLLEYNVKYP